MTDSTQRTGYLAATDSEGYYGAIFRVHREMHARVSEPVAVPARIRHSAYRLPESEPHPLERVRQRFEEIVRLLHIAPDHIAVKRALLAMKKPEHAAVLKQIYDIDGFVEARDADYDPVRDALELMDYRPNR
jgi:hypothetical protein